MSKKKKGAIAGVAAAVVIVCAAGAGNATYTINAVSYTHLTLPTN